MVARSPSALSSVNEDTSLFGSTCSAYLLAVGDACGIKCFATTGYLRVESERHLATVGASGDLFADDVSAVAALNCPMTHALHYSLTIAI